MGVELMPGIEACLKDADVVMMLRIQHERQKVLDTPAIQEYRRFYSLTRERLRLARSNAILMHPGPVNRGVELPPGLADSDQSIILRQVTNGIAVRMAVLYVLLTRGA